MRLLYRHGLTVEDGGKDVNRTQCEIWCAFSWLRTGFSSIADSCTSSNKHLCIKKNKKFHYYLSDCELSYTCAMVLALTTHSLSPFWSIKLFILWPSTFPVGTAVAQWLRCCATNWKVAGSIPDDVIGIFYWHNPSDRTMALGLAQPLTEMSTRSISWG